MSTDKFQHYQTQQIMTASPAMLVFMLYDKAISCLQEAVRAIEAGETEARWKANGRAMEIIEHLRVTLNMEAGGEISQNLEKIYALLLRELPKVDLRNDAELAHKCIKLLQPLRDSWHKLADMGEEATRLAAQTAAQQTPNLAAPAPKIPVANTDAGAPPPADKQGRIKVSA